MESAGIANLVLQMPVVVFSPLVGVLLASRWLVSTAMTDVKRKLAQLDLASYLLTGLPLLFGFALLINEEPTARMFNPSSAGAYWVSAAVVVIAGIGFGTGIARRLFSLKTI